MGEFYLMNPSLAKYPDLKEYLTEAWGFANENSIVSWIKNNNMVNFTEGYVPGSILLFIRKKTNRIIGTIRVFPYKCPVGNIGYYIRPSERGKGYAVHAVKLALEMLKIYGQTEAIITTEHDNESSKRVIAKLGGELVEKRQYLTGVVEHYAVKIK